MLEVFLKLIYCWFCLKCCANRCYRESTEKKWHPWLLCGQRWWLRTNPEGERGGRRGKEKWEEGRKKGIEQLRRTHFVRDDHRGLGGFSFFFFGVEEKRERDWHACQTQSGSVATTRVAAAGPVCQLFKNVHMSLMRTNYIDNTTTSSLFFSFFLFDIFLENTQENEAFVGHVSLSPTSKNMKLTLFSIMKNSGWDVTDLELWFPSGNSATKKKCPCQYGLTW